MKYIIFLSILLIGCKAKLIPIKETFHRSDTTIITERAVPVEVPGSSVYANVDSLIGVLANLPKEKVRIVKVSDPSSQTKLTFFYDSLTKQLIAKCETLEKTYYAQVEEKETIIKEYKEVIAKERKNFGDTVKQIILYIVVGAAVLIILLIVLSIFAYRKFVPRV